jgi:hypothetical protein
VPDADRKFTGTTTAIKQHVYNSQGGYGPSVFAGNTEPYNQLFEINLLGRSSQSGVTDYRSAVVIGNDNGVLESFVGLPIPSTAGTPAISLCVSNGYIRDGMGGNFGAGNNDNVRGGSLRGNSSSTTTPSSTEGDPRALNEQLRFLNYASGMANTDQTRFYSTINSNQLPDGSTMGLPNTNYVNPARWVDVSSTDQKVTIRVRVNNDNLPASTSISADLRKLDQNNNWRDELGIGDFRLASGTVANGVYEAELVVPKNYKSGNYTLDSLSVQESGNYNGPSKRWSRYGSNIPAEFRKSLRVSGTADRTAPELKGLTLSNATLDTRNGTATFSATLQITDDMVGLMGDSNGWDEGGAIGFSSPSGVGYAWSQIRRSNRISGTSANGTYQVWFQLPQHSEEGTWTLDYIELRDRNDNTRFLIPANLVAMRIPVPTIEVQGHPRGWEQQAFSATTTTKTNATINLGDLVQTANGTGKTPSVSIAPGTLSQNVTLTYNGTTTAPTAPGTYTVVAYLNHPAYQGRTVSTMTINSPKPPVVATPSSGGGSPKADRPGKNGGSKNKSSGSAKKSGGSAKKSEAKKSGGASKKKSDSGKKSGGKKKKG